MPYITGRNGYLAIGSQTGPGTPATSTIFLSLSGDSGVELTSEINVLEPQGSIEPSLYWIVGTWVAGRVEARLHPAYDGSLINWLLARDATGEAPYFTIVQAYGSTLVWKFVDCKINTATLTFRTVEIPTISMEFIGKSQAAGTWSAPTVPTDLVWLSHNVTITVGTTNFSPVTRSVELTINNNIAAARDMIRFGAQGPVALPAGDRMIEGRMTIDLKSADSEVNIDTLSFVNSILAEALEGSLQIGLSRTGASRTIQLPRVVWHYPTGVTVPSGAAGTPRTADIAFNALAGTAAAIIVS